MKGVFALSLGLTALFSTLLLGNLVFGWITPESVRAFLEGLRGAPHARAWLALTVIGVLTADSLLSIPTVATCVLAGYFLGPLSGGAAAALGILLAGSLCYWGGRAGGQRFLRRLVAPEESARLQQWFDASGGLALLLARAVPMMPEVLSCLAGISNVSFGRYVVLFGLGNVPFAFLAAWAGAHSSFENPEPALIVGLGLPAAAWVLWLVLRRAT